MAVVDDKAHWAARVEQLDMDVLEGEKRLEALVKAVSGLIAEDADSKKIAAAKRVADEAHRDLGHLRGALGEAQLRHRKELEAQEIEVLRQRADDDPARGCRCQALGAAKIRFSRLVHLPMREASLP
jgi:hypothetical protein